jgi:hypothetical protein
MAFGSSKAGVTLSQLSNVLRLEMADALTWNHLTYHMPSKELGTTVLQMSKHRPEARLNQSML